MGAAFFFRNLSPLAMRRSLLGDVPSPFSPVASFSLDALGGGLGVAGDEGGAETFFSLSPDALISSAGAACTDLLRVLNMLDLGAFSAFSLEIVAVASFGGKGEIVASKAPLFTFVWGASKRVAGDEWSQKTKKRLVE